jgi:hypothetical protein
MSVFKITGPNERSESTVDSLTKNLGELLFTMFSDERPLICIAEFPKGQYVQFLSKSDTMLGEIVSNYYLAESIALNEHDEEFLKKVGFNEPTPTRLPNWWYRASDERGIIEMVKIMNSALFAALHLSSSDLVSVRTFKAPSSK